VKVQNEVGLHKESKNKQKRHALIVKNKPFHKNNLMNIICKI